MLTRLHKCAGWSASLLFTSSKIRFLLFMFHVCLYYTVLSVPCSLEITCWERAELLALMCVTFPCVFVTFPYGILGQVWYLIASIPDLCLLYFLTMNETQFFIIKLLSESIKSCKFTILKKYIALNASFDIFSSSTLSHTNFLPYLH